MRTSFASSRRPAHKAASQPSPLAWLLNPALSVPRTGERRRNVGVWRIDPLRGDRRKSTTLFN